MPYWMQNSITSRKWFLFIWVIIGPIMSYEAEKSLNKNAENDYITLSEQWPQSSCWYLNRHFPTEQDSCTECKFHSHGKRWTLHGLWPSKTNGKHPTFCNSDIKFDLNQIETLIKTLEEQWSSFNLKGNNIHFWKYEWEKHGTCALHLETINSLSKYFSTALQLLNKYNVGLVLQNSSIVPGNEYDLSNIYQVFKNSLEVKVNAFCIIDKVLNKQYLIEVHLCMDNAYTLINCPVVKHTCNTDKKIIYPKKFKAC